MIGASGYADRPNKVYIDWTYQKVGTRTQYYVLSDGWLHVDGRRFISALGSTYLISQLCLRYMHMRAW
jgi:hypothetical protein